MALSKIGNNALADDAVTTDKITDANVTNAKLATDSVSQAKVADNAIGADELANNAVVDASVSANAAIQGTKISGIDVSSVENEIGLLRFDRLVDNSAAIDNFVAGFADEFHDETGVNTKTSLTYDSTNDHYTPTENTTTALTDIDNNSTNWAGNTNNWTFGPIASSGNFGGNQRTGIYYSVSSTIATGDLASIQLADTTNQGIFALYEATAQSHIGTSGNRYDLGFGSSSSNHWANGNPTGQPIVALRFGNGNVQGVRPGGASSTNVTYSTNDVFKFVRSANSVITVEKNGTTETTLSGHTDATIDADFRIAVGHNAEGASLNLSDLKVSTSGSGDGTFQAGTFISNGFTASSAPSAIRIIAIGEEVDSQTMNTDTVFSASRDNGSTFTAATMTNAAVFNGDVDIFVGEADVSGQSSGTTVKMKMTTTANKRFVLHGYAVIFKS